MNIEKWPIEKKMQLPDWCFGQRWALSCELRTAVNVTVWDISEVAFPNIGVIWEININPYYVQYRDNYIRMALGPKLPASAAIMNELEPLVMGLGYQAAKPRKIYLYGTPGLIRIYLRQAKEFQGRRLIVEGYNSTGNHLNVRVIVVVSSMPKEVPDWLFSGRAALQS